MRILSSVSCLVLLSAILCFADDPKPNPSSFAALKQAVQAIEPTLKKLGPDATVEYRGEQTVVITYLPRKFKVHGSTKGGEFTADVHDEVGPSAKGFILQAHVQSRGEVNQAVTPQTIRLPYWATDLDLTTVGQTDHQLYWSLSYGSRTDHDLLESLRTKIRALKN